LAYAAAITWREFSVGGIPHLILRVSETEAASGSEWSTVHTAVTNTVTHQPSGVAESIPLAVRERYRVGTVLMVECDRTAGTGTTVQPKLGKAAAWSTGTTSVIYTWDSADAADFVHTVTPVQYAFIPTETACHFYGRSTPNSAVADHSITTLILIRSGG
jgi:hypothetical protein